VRTSLRVAWIAVKVALVLQFGAAVAQFVYQGF
jgi:hypothetical protein